MISQIDIEEFRIRLKENTKLGNPKMSGTVFHAFNIIGEKDKLYYGRLNQNDFAITKNAILYPIPYVLEAKIKSKNLNQTEITYKIIPIKFGYYWIRYFPIIAFFLFNTIFIIEKPPLIVWILFNLFIVFTGLSLNIRMNNQRKSFERKFKQFFEIVDNE